MVGDGILADRNAAARKHDGKLGVEAEIVFFEWERLEDFRAHHLVAGRLVGEMRAVQDIADPGEQAAADEEREVHELLLLLEPPRAENRSRIMLFCKLEKCGNLFGAVLEICILNDGVVPLRVTIAHMHGRSFSAIFLGNDDVLRACEGPENFQGSILRPVIHKNHLRKPTRVMESLNNGRERFLFIIDRHDDGKAWRCHGRSIEAIPDALRHYFISSMRRWTRCWRL